MRREPMLLYRPFAQCLQTARDEVPGRLVSGDDEQNPEVGELSVTEAAAISFCPQEQADEIIAGPPPLGGRHPAGILERFDEGPLIGLNITASVFRVIEADNMIAPFV